MRKDIWREAGSRIKRTGFLFLCFLTAAGFFAAGFSAYRKTAAGSFYISGYYKEAQISAGDMKKFLENQSHEKSKGRNLDIPQTAGWARTDDISFERADGTEEEGILFQVCGSMEVLFSDGLCGGNLPWREDKSGCVISTALAWELYGGKEAVGNQIFVQGREYFIRGILEEDKSFLAVPAQESDQMENFRMKYKSAKEPVSAAESFLYQMTGKQPDAVFEGVFFAGLSRIILFVTILILEVFCLAVLWRRIRKIETGRVRIPLKIILSLLFFMLFFLEGFRAFSFSWDYLPSMWSDLSFYPQLFKEKAEMVKKLLETQLCPADEMTLACLWKTGVCSAAGTAAGCLLHFLRK